MPLIEACPNATVLEALQIESEGKSVWGEKQDADDVDQIESVRLFICLVVDAIYRDCNFASVRHLWDLMVASNSQHSALFGAACREVDVLIIMTLLLVLHVNYMLHVLLFCVLYVLRFSCFGLCVHVFEWKA